METRKNPPAFPDTKTNQEFARDLIASLTKNGKNIQYINPDEIWTTTTTTTTTTHDEALTDDSLSFLLNLAPSGGKILINDPYFIGKSSMTKTPTTVKK